MKYLKKPVIIEAIQLKKDNISKVLNFMGQTVRLPSFQGQQRFDQYKNSVIENGMTIHTLEDGKDQSTYISRAGARWMHPTAGNLSQERFRAKHVASIGDYIIKGVKGEFYPCKPDIFKMTYEPVND